MLSVAGSSRAIELVSLFVGGKVEGFQDVRVTHRVDERLRAVRGPHVEELARVPDGLVQDQRYAHRVGRGASSRVEEESTRLNRALRERNMALPKRVSLLNHSSSQIFEKGTMPRRT